LLCHRNKSLEKAIIEICQNNTVNNEKRKGNILLAVAIEDDVNNGRVSNHHIKY